MSRPVYRRSQPYVERIRRLFEAPEGRAILNRLTSKERDCLFRYYVGGESLCEIAGALGRNISTVSRNIHRGEARLDKAWGLCLGEDA